MPEPEVIADRWELERLAGVGGMGSHGRLEDGKLWLALEWPEGEDLEARLRGRGLSMRESLLGVEDVGPKYRERQ